MVHCVDPPPSPLIRSSFGFVAVENEEGAANDVRGRTVQRKPKAETEGAAAVGKKFIAGAPIRFCNATAV